MPFHNLLDMHTHTDNSFDGHHSVIYLCESALERGLRAIAFTDHVEMDAYAEKGFDRSAQQAYFESVKGRSAFRGKLIVCVGVELGQPTYNPQAAEELLQRYAYDVVIGSVHNLRGQLDFWFLDYDQLSDDALVLLLKEYFDELLQLCAWGKFDVLAHLTYPLRYICGEHGRNPDWSALYPQVDAVLASLVKQGIALEINTSGLRQKIGKTLPEAHWVRRFKELGGQRVTVGSDAHYAEHVGAGLQEGLLLARQCGFEQITFFQRREPMQAAIV